MMSGSSCLVSFEVHCPDTKPGEHLRVVGSSSLLGSWLPERSLARLATSDRDFPRWRSEWLPLARAESVEYKYVICSAEGEARCWEGRCNRRIAFPTESERLLRSESFGEPPDAEDKPIAADDKSPVASQGSAQSTEDEAAEEEDALAAFDMVASIPSWDSAASGFSVTKQLSSASTTDCGSSMQRTLSMDSDSLSSSGMSQVQECPTGSEVSFSEFGSFEEAFYLGHMLGDGAFGVVHKCRERKTGTLYAVKVVETEGLHPLDEAAIATEVQLQLSLPPHENIVRLLRSFQEASCMRLVMEYCQGGDLSSHIDDLRQRHKWRGGDMALSEVAAASVVQQLLGALAFCHSCGVVHRDVKPGNVLLAAPAKHALLESDRGLVKLCDFGYATRCCLDEPPSLRECVGSPGYVAPEMVRREAYGCAVDVWSAGVLLFECLRGVQPFAASSDREVARLVRSANYSFDSAWCKLSEQARACTEHLLTVDPAQRPGARVATAHTWLAGHCGGAGR